MTARRAEHGFTLPELLVAITVLGIIMLAIGAMITTSFRTSRTVSEELQGSRAPKMVSRYWVPDVEQAGSVTTGGGCGAEGDPVVTLSSKAYESAFEQPSHADTATDRVVTWSVVPNGRRDQLVRTACLGGVPSDRTVVVSELAATRPDTHKSRAPRYVITVTVPDRSERASGTYSFDVAGASQLTSTTSAP